MQTKINELGRSMVEILGVLAVIGVLSVAGILGYKFAMNKYIANETVNELAIRANDIAYQMDKLIEANYAGEIEMELGNTTRMGYPIMARMSPQYEEYFEIFLSEVPSDICKLLLQSQWQSPYSIFVGIEEYEATPDICNSAEKVELAYEFYKDMRGKEEVPEDSRHEITRCRYDNDCRCGTCSEGLCVSSCGPKEQCVKDSDNPHQLKCCPDDKVLGGLCCSSIVNGECCTTMGQCCSPDTPLWDTTGLCHSCTEDALITVENAYLCGAICENRTVMSGKYCSLKCKDNEFKDTSGKCRKCTDAGSYFTQATQAECDKCSQRTRGFCANKQCCMLNCDVPGTYTEGKKLWDYDGICRKCSETAAFTMAIGYEADCEKLCDERVLIAGRCLLNVCSTKEKPLMDESGNCYACTEPKALPKQSNCTTACPNEREISSTGKCILKTCGTEKFKSTDRGCLDCEDAGDYYTQATEAECNKCSQRTRGFCANKQCCMLNCDVLGTYTEGKPLQNYDGICYSCNTRSAVSMPVGKSNSCETICPNRTLEGNKCVFRECSAGMFSGNDQVCYDCGIVTPIATTEKECKRCLNREYGTDGYCGLKNI